MINGRFSIRLVEHPFEVIEIFVSEANHNGLIPVLKRHWIRAENRLKAAQSIPVRDRNREPQLILCGLEAVCRGCGSGSWILGQPPDYIFIEHQNTNKILTHYYSDSIYTRKGPWKELPLTIYDPRADSYHSESKKERSIRLELEGN